MNDLMFHADRKLPAIVHGGTAPWLPSPLPGIERRLLERVGGEVALASSIVRYAPGSGFTSHRHDFGEEFVVLEGVFSDEHGDYCAGTYVRNPPSSQHAPFSASGCMIFVKLRQMQADETQRLLVFPNDREWTATTHLGHEYARLFASGGVTVDLAKLAPGLAWHAPISPGGEELFVVQGSFELLEPKRTTLQALGWSRLPACGHTGHAGPDGALIWVKRGHL